MSRRPRTQSACSHAPRAASSASVEPLENRTLFTALVDADLHRPAAGLRALVDGDLHRPPTVVADFDADGRADLAVADNSGPLGLRLLHNNGDGTFTQTAFLPIDAPAGGALVSDLAAGDLNGDGLPDLAYKLFSVTGQPTPVGESASARVGVLTNTGKGTFRPSGLLDTRMAINTKGTGVAGRATAPALEILVTLDGASKDAARAYTNTAIGPNFTGLAVGDLDGDGLADLVSWIGTGVSYLRGVKGGGFEPARATLSPGADGSTNQWPTLRQFDAVADLDGDGRAELIGDDGVRVLTATLASTDPLVFRPAKPDAIPSPDISINRVVAGDFNGDGAADLLVISSGQYQVIRGGIRTPGDDVGMKALPPQPLPAPQGNVLVGDLDGDGAADLFTLQLKLGSGIQDEAKGFSSIIR